MTVKPKVIDFFRLLLLLLLCSFADVLFYVNLIFFTHIEFMLHTFNMYAVHLNAI